MIKIQVQESFGNRPNNRHEEEASSASSPSPSPTSFPEDFAELHVQESAPPPQRSGLDALALACAAEVGTSALHSTAAEGTSVVASDATAQEMVVASNEEGSSTALYRINRNDVLCGRGGLTNHHLGNMNFRGLVRIKQESYLLASKREKAGVAREIVEMIRALSPPGRFLKRKHKCAKAWVEIGDRKAREKTSQALREGAPELRETVSKQPPPRPTPSKVEAPSTSHMQQQMQMQHSRAYAHQAHHDNTEKSLWLNNTNNAIDQSSQPTNPITNRTRIVSDDSVGVWGFRNDKAARFIAPMHESQYNAIDHDNNDIYAGPKRKSPPSCSEQAWETSHEEQSKKGGGPRLKLLKSRLTEYCAI